MTATTHNLINELISVDPSIDVEVLFEGTDDELIRCTKPGSGIAVVTSIRDDRHEIEAGLAGENPLSGLITNGFARESTHSDTRAARWIVRTFA